MSVESIPNFTHPAAELWAALPVATKKLLLANVYCGHCGHCGRAVTITNYSGVVKGGDLLLVGKCAECLGDVARVIEIG